MTEQIDPQKQRNARLKLIALLSLFLVPFLIAMFMHQKYRAGGELDVSSNGELIWPAVPLEPFSALDVRAEKAVDLEWLQDRWSLLYIAQGECGDVCAKNVYHMRQIHVSLGKEAHRVQRLMASDMPDSVLAVLENEYPNLTLVAETAEQSALSDQVVNAVKNLSIQPDSLYLIDPLGNLMLRFSPQQDPKGILKDIKRALRNSRIG